MQSDFDKILKDKLRGYEADFNPADWQKMEAMLPEKSKKPYGLLALLLLFFGIGGLLVGTGEFKQDSYSDVIKSETNSLDKNAVADLQNNSESEKADRNEVGIESDIQKQNAEKPESTQNTGAHQSGISKSSDNVRTPSPAGEGRGEVTTKKRSASNQKNLSISNDSQQTSSRKKISNSISYESNSQQSYSRTIENTNENSADIQNNTESVFALASIESGFINLSDEEKIFAEKSALSDDDLPKHKPKQQIVTFALGGGAGINFSFTDAKRWTKPGYTVDVAQEVIFINRIGIAFTQGYSVRNYDGGQYPCPSGTLNCPTSYSSTVRSIDFGVDLKANLIHKTRWNWYVKTGVINSVKLKEEFSYGFPQTDTIMPPTLPPKTNFNGSSSFTANEAMHNPLAGLDAGSYPPDITISGVKRYHIAFHSATGFDVALNSKLRIQAEAGHSFTQPIVGVENRRLHSISIHTRLLYRFGR